MRSAERRRRSHPTVRTLLRDAVQRLEAARVSYGHGTLNARDEAAWLILHALKLPLDDLVSRLSREVSSDEAKTVDALIDERIRTRKPTAYLTREAWLGDHSFYVDERVIVPRSYIAELLRERLAPWIAKRSNVGAALDLCTGSGCLAVLTALTFPQTRIDAADVSRDALDVARRNIRDYGLGRRVRLVRSDLFSALRDRSYDLIVSNPPYVSAAAMRGLPAEYRSEPAVALAGGRDGLDFVRRIVTEAPRHLNPGGLLLVEVGHYRERVERAFPRLPLVWAQTSGGDDCVFGITREALCSPSPPRSARASRAAVSLHPPEASSPARASGAAAARRRRSARASSGSR
ncbi:MAG TPA: 50S ribosomal protein L3 N(5)-glutamine methyltransferase [Burkholderiales bacterium]|nr:50S ribosomal protein L3 N(5)-glutamine methyltransferase [Burkholderiales bacterium]